MMNVGSATVIWIITEWGPLKADGRIDGEIDGGRILVRAHDG
jgi:hypothetical protein